MSESQIQHLESMIGITFPDSYRAYLVATTDGLLDRAIDFRSPRSGTVDEILTVEEILENDAQGRIGIPDKSLLHIGGNLCGGCLYLNVSDERFGEISYMENYMFKETFASFDELLSEPREELEE